MTEVTAIRRFGRGGSRRRRLAVSSAAVLAIVILASGCIVNGTWTATVPAAVGAPSPAGVTFADVSCLSATWCMAVGWNGNTPVVQTWNGTAWANAPTPPEGPAGGRVEAVDCATASRCLAKVDRFEDAPLDYEYLMAWNGTSWSDVPPGGVWDGEHMSFSCTTSGSCVILDNRHNTTTIWNGTSFAVTDNGADSPGDANIDCVSATDCLAGGGEWTFHWDGTSWSVVATTLPVGGLRSISCSSGTSCVGVGFEASDGITPAAAHWDGTTWTKDPVPAGLTQLVDVSCVSSGECLATGVPFAPYPASVAKVLTWSGATWYEAPVPPGGAGAVYAASSCVATSCMAVGSTSTPSPQLLASSYGWTYP